MARSARREHQVQLGAARCIIYELDLAQETRVLSPQEQEIRRDLKGKVLGLPALERTMARQRARCRYLREGDANTKYFHLQACHRRRKNHMHAISVDGRTFSEEEAKAGIAYDYYNSILGTPFMRRHRIDLQQLGLPHLDLEALVAPFTADKVAAIVRASHRDRTPGPDGFTGGFYLAAWEVIGGDVVKVFDAFWQLDFRSLHHLNGAVMVLLHKTDDPQGLRDYRPISLIHSIGKLLTKCLATRLAPFMAALVRPNQMAFIRGCLIHENFRAVQLTCRWLHARRHVTILLKVDLAKAFDTVAWPFLLELMQHKGFPQHWCEWISALLGTASTKVLINGRLGRHICHAIKGIAPG